LAEGVETLHCPKDTIVHTRKLAAAKSWPPIPLKPPNLRGQRLAPGFLLTVIIKQADLVRAEMPIRSKFTR
jgi:hypothetical protein